MKVKAEAKWLRIGARKMRRVLGLIKGKPADEALAYLKFLPQKGARLIEKVVKAAVANAVNNYKLPKTGLIIVEAYVNDAPMYKRMQPRAKGRGFPIKKRNSHLSVWVSESKEAI
jgi:large subunit ribosomal protein L22